LAINITDTEPENVESSCHKRTSHRGHRSKIYAGW